MTGTLISINISAGGGVPKHPVDSAIVEWAELRVIIIGSSNKKAGISIGLSVFSLLRIFLPSKMKGIQ